MRRRSVVVTDKQWAKIEPLLPVLPAGPQGGRPWADNRAMFEGILWVLKTGARWRDLPEGYPSGSTCWRRGSDVGRGRRLARPLACVPGGARSKTPDPVE
jgi:transposase